MRIGIDYTAAVRQGAGIGRYLPRVDRGAGALDHDSEYTLLIAGRPAPRREGDPESAFARRATFACAPAADRALANRLWHRLQLPLPVESLHRAAGPLPLARFYAAADVRRADAAHRARPLLPARAAIRRPAACGNISTQVVPRSVRRADLVLADSRAHQTRSHRAAGRARGARPGGHGRGGAALSPG